MAYHTSKKGKTFQVVWALNLNCTVMKVCVVQPTIGWWNAKGGDISVQLGEAVV